MGRVSRFIPTPLTASIFTQQLWNNLLWQWRSGSNVSGRMSLSRLRTSMPWCISSGVHLPPWLNTMRSSFAAMFTSRTTRRKMIITLTTGCLCFAALSLWASWNPSDGRRQYIPFGNPYLNSTADDSSFTKPLPSTPQLKEGNASLLETAPTYIKAIMNPEDTSFPRMSCPTPDGSRYEYLRGNTTTIYESNAQLKYFFALDLHQCASLLPRLIGSIVETMRFLGPRDCALSIVEGRSDDGTFEVLKLLRQEIEGIGAQYFFNTSDLDPSGQTVQRIVALAELRNQALQPLIQSPDHYSPDTTILFLNDVSICMEDMLELIHQRVYQNADMTCAMDWTYVGRDPTFYDVWVARGLNGDSFFNIPEDGNWNSAWNLFWNNPEAQSQYMAHKPFQVFSCWNGATAFTAKPIIEQKIRFRSSSVGECYQGEPQLFCKDMWRQGYGKLAVIPAVNLEYSDEAATRIKALKGYVSQHVNKDGDIGGDSSLRIDWEMSPPPLVKCIPQSYANQTWRAWDE